jgi:serine/threonine-protein kinase
VLVPGDRLGRYTLIDRLATGGMAEIYLARLEGAAGFAKHLVLKLILPDLAEDEHFVSMFLREARIAARIQHPNVCQVFELGETGGVYFIAMEYLDGVPLVPLMQSGPSPRLSATLLAQACEGLHYAHELCDAEGKPLGVVHRDVSPSNLFVTADGSLKVLDFGVAKALDSSVRSATGGIKGKHAYMAPEQLLGQPVDRRADVFALGVVGFEMLSGQRLFRRENDFQTLRAVTEEPLPQLSALRPELPAPLCEAIHHALERDPAKRFATARAFGEALTEAIGTPLAGFALGSEIQKLVGDKIAERRDRVGRALADAKPVDVSDAPTSFERPRRPRSQTRYWMGGLLLTAAAAAATTWYLATRPPAMATVSAPKPIVAPDASVAVVEAPLAKSETPPAKSDTPPAKRPDPPHRKNPPSGAPGFFSIDSTPYANIFVDGKPFGSTPIFRRELAPGKHAVRAVSKTGAVRSFSIEIRSGQESPKRLTW